MPPPKVLTNVGAADPAASRSFANVKSAVDPLLTLINTTFAVGNDGALSFLRRIKTFAADAIVANSSFVSKGPVTVGGVLTANSGVKATGASTLKGSVVVQKNDDGTGGSELVQGNLTILGATSSSTGFKTFGPLFTYNGAIAAGAYVNMGIAGVANNMVQKYPFAGSVVGVDISFYCSATTSTLQFFVTGSTGDIVNTYAPNNNTSGIYFSTPYAKGTYPFAAQGDVLCKVYSPTAISSIQLSITPILEMSA